MKCEKCGGNLNVVETAKNKKSVLRKRVCDKCNKVFYTRETVDDKAYFDLRRTRYLNRATGE